jgi:hypothetical protein
MTNGQRSKKAGGAAADAAHEAPSTPARKPDTAAPKGTASGPSLAQQHADAHRQYSSAYRQIWEESWHAGQEAARELWLEIQEVQQTARQAVKDAHRAYVRAKLEIGDDPDSRQLSLAAYRDYQDTLQKIALNSQRGWDAAHHAYHEAISANPGEFQRRSAAAYRDYLQAVRDAWAAVDVDTLDAVSLGRVARSLGGAAQHVAATLGPAAGVRRRAASA